MFGASAPVKYDGRFTIVRLWYPHAIPGWSFDYPDMEQNLTLILNELTLDPRRTRTAATSSGWMTPSC